MWASKNGEITKLKAKRDSGKYQVTGDKYQVTNDR